MNQLELFRAACVRYVAVIERAGLHVTFSPGGMDWRRDMAAMKDRGETPFLSPSFDPTENPTINEDNCTSITCQDKGGHTQACIAVRKYNGDVRDVVASGWLWLNDGNLVSTQDRITTWPGGKQWDFHGSCTQRGGLYVSDSWRGKGIGSSLSMLALHYSFLRFHVKHSIGLRKAGDGPDGTVAREAPIAMAEIGTPKMGFRLTHVSRDEAARWAAELIEPRPPSGRLDATGDDQADNIVALPIKNRDNEPSIA